jgi:hypothetical protein
MTIPQSRARKEAVTIRSGEDVTLPVQRLLQDKAFGFKNATPAHSGH